jgi:hypothetical protein
MTKRFPQKGTQHTFRAEKHVDKLILRVIDKTGWTKSKVLNTGLEAGLVTVPTNGNGHNHKTPLWKSNSSRTTRPRSSSGAASARSTKSLSVAK